jgi:beta-glucosidase
MPFARLSVPSTAGEPPKQLKGYQRVYLQPGGSAPVTVTLDPRAFAYWNTARHTWVVAPGTYRILAGASSRDLRLQGSAIVPGQTLSP